MMIWFNTLYFQLQIKLLILFKPTLLFDKINRLDWYKNTLHQWADDRHFAIHDKVLEVGCASGSLTGYVAQSGCTTTGVDASEQMIQLAKRKHNNLDFKVAEAVKLPFAENSFDAVIAASLLNIVSAKEKVMTELVRNCKKGGAVTVLVPAAQFSDDDLRSLQVSLGSSGFSAVAMEAWHRLPPKMAADDIVSLFEQAGLTNMTTEYYLNDMVVSVSGIKPL